jgi:hypothetical protein
MLTAEEARNCMEKNIHLRKSQTIEVLNTAIYRAALRGECFVNTDVDVTPYESTLLENGYRIIYSDKPEVTGTLILWSKQ